MASRVELKNQQLENKINQMSLGRDLSAEMNDISVNESAEIAGPQTMEPKSSAKKQGARKRPKYQLVNEDKSASDLSLGDIKGLGQTASQNED